MTKKIIISAMLLVLITSTHMTCNKDNNNDCESMEVGVAEALSSPSTGNLNENIPIVTRFIISNGCGSFSGFTTQTSGDTVVIKPIITYKGCVCTQALIYVDSNYTFRTQTAGRYFFKMLQYGQQYLLDSIDVN